MIKTLSLQDFQINFNLLDCVELGILEEKELLKVLKILDNRYGLYGFSILNNEFIVKKVSPKQAFFRLKLANNIKNYKLDKYLRNIGEKKYTDSSGRVLLSGPDEDKIVLKNETVFIDIHSFEGRGLSWDELSNKVKADLSHYEPICDLDVLRASAYDYLNYSFPAHSEFISASIFS